LPPQQFRSSARASSGRYLSFADRESIALLKVQGYGVRAIARELGRSPSTISRELRRNAVTRSGILNYRAVNAQWHADRAARRPKILKLLQNARLREYVQERLAGRIISADGMPVKHPNVIWKGRRAVHRQQRRWATCWSPEQISRRLRADFPEDESMRISHEAIYQSLYIQSRGALRRDLTACLRTGRPLRVPRKRAQRIGRSFVDPQLLISNRSADINDRAIYFCDPHSPWQRGSNENTNGLLRQYFPKGTDLSRHTATQLAAIARTLNARPRKTLGWKTPAEAFYELLRNTDSATVASTN
jgi:IS30 family transposase